MSAGIQGPMPEAQERTEECPSLFAYGNFPGSNKWAGGVKLRDNRVLMVPAGASSILIYCAADNTWEEFGDFKGSSKWSCGITLADSRVLLVPKDACSMLLFSPGSGTWEQLGQFEGSAKWSTGLLLPSDKVLFVPDCASSILVFTPKSNTWQELGSFEGHYKWSDAVELLDGRVLFVPAGASSMLLMQPTKGTWELLGHFDGEDKWACGILLLDGRVLCVPRCATFILIFNPKDNTWEEIGQFGGQFKWSGGVLLPDGRVVLVPDCSSFILIFHPKSGQYEQLGSFDGPFKWSGGVLLHNFSVLFVPDCASGILVLDPARLTWELFSCFHGPFKWSEGLLANGRLVFVPSSSAHILVAEHVPWNAQVLAPVPPGALRALDTLRKMWVERVFTDAVVDAGCGPEARRSIPVHRAVLAVRSQALLELVEAASADWEGFPVHVKMPGDPAAVEALLEYLYVEQLPPADPLAVLPLALQLGLVECVAVCLGRMESCRMSDVVRALAPLANNQAIFQAWAQVKQQIRFNTCLLDRVLHELASSAGSHSAPAGCDSGDGGSCSASGACGSDCCDDVAESGEMPEGGKDVTCDVVHFNAPLRASFLRVVMDSELGHTLSAHGTRVRPGWAKGATVLVDGMTSEVMRDSGVEPSSLRPWKAVVRADDVPSLLNTLHAASARRRLPRVNMSKSKQFVWRRNAAPVEQASGSGCHPVTEETAAAADPLPMGEVAVGADEGVAPQEAAPTVPAQAGQAVGPFVQDLLKPVESDMQAELGSEPEVLPVKEESADQEPAAASCEGHVQQALAA